MLREGGGAPVKTKLLITSTEGHNIGHDHC